MYLKSKVIIAGRKCSLENLQYDFMEEESFRKAGKEVHLSTLYEITKLSLSLYTETTPFEPLQKFYWSFQ